jgi:hypothetical protein
MTLNSRPVRALQMNNTNNIPAVIVPAIIAYYHVPLVWVGSCPTEDELRAADLSQLIRDEIRHTVAEQIEVRVRRDGMFIFDFTRWPEAPPTEIPEHDRVPGKRLPQSVTAAEDLVAGREQIRVMVLNAHQACLSTAHSVVHRRATGLGVPVSPQRAIKPADFEAAVVGRSLSNVHDPLERYVSERLLGTLIHRDATAPRLLLEKDTVIYSLELLEQIVTSPFADLLLLTELLYRAAVQYSEYRFAESLILSWAVCERLLTELWERYLKSSERSGTGELRINADRRQRLKSRDYTSSVRLEVLELAGQLPTELFGAVDDVRKSRNNWLHSLSNVKGRRAALAVRAAESLFRFTTGLTISLTLSKSGSWTQVQKTKP